MKKGIIIILAVALIGIAGLAARGHDDNAAPLSAPASQSDNSSVQSARTDSQPAGYKDGNYTGDTENTVYGQVQVAVMVSGGKITGVNFLRMPDDRGHTQEVTAFAEPLLKDETLRKQSAHIDFVGGATQTSEGYQESLQSALDMAAQA